jgi:hypothetical protein
MLEHISKWDDGLRIFSIRGTDLKLSTEWLFKKLRFDLECDVQTYAYSESKIYLWGSYKRENCPKIKKFFYDSYPCVEKIEFVTFGIRVYFKCRVLLTDNYNY